jgi:hypothetical protein
MDFMPTKYEFLTKDDSNMDGSAVIFYTDLKLDDDYLTDIPPTLLIPTQAELEHLNSISTLALLQLIKYKSEIDQDLLSLSNKVYEIVW